MVPLPQISTKVTLWIIVAGFTVTMITSMLYFLKGFAKNIPIAYPLKAKHIILKIV